MDGRGEAPALNRGIIGALWGPAGWRLLAGDAVVVLLCVCAGAGLLLAPGRARTKAGTVQVEVSGSTVLTLSPSDEGVHEVSGPLGVTGIEIRDGMVRVISSPCPLKLCRRAGWIGAAGEMIVCLPNEVVVRLPGRRRGVDAVSR